MRVFRFDDYASFLKSRIERMPKHGHGQLRQMAEYIRIHPTRLSHVLAGKVDLTLEQGALLCQYLGLNDLETEFFLVLIQFARAGNAALRGALQKQMARLRESAQELSKILPRDATLTETDQARFYSSWKYSAVRLASDLPGPQDAISIASRLKIPVAQVQRILEFLVSKNLCLEDDSRLRIGPKRTHLEQSSPWITRHHGNWRIKAMESHEQMTPSDLAYSGLMGLSEKEQSEIRGLLIGILEQVTARAAQAPTEKLVF